VRFLSRFPRIARVAVAAASLVALAVAAGAGVKFS
jgi:hypothetical protein